MESSKHVTVGGGGNYSGPPSTLGVRVGSAQGVTLREFLRAPEEYPEEIAQLQSLARLMAEHFRGVLAEPMMREAIESIREATSQQLESVLKTLCEARDSAYYYALAGPSSGPSLGTVTAVARRVAASEAERVAAENEHLTQRVDSLESEVAALREDLDQLQHYAHHHWGYIWPEDVFDPPTWDFDPQAN